MAKKLEDFPAPQQALIKAAIQRYPYSSHSFLFGTYIPDDGFINTCYWSNVGDHDGKSIWVNQFAEHIEVEI